MKLLDLLHPRDHRNAEGTPFLTVSAGDTVLCPGAESLVVGPDGLRDLGLHHRQIVQLVDHGNVDALGTGSTVAAVGALPGVGVKRRSGQRAGIVPFFLGGCLISHRRQHMLRAVVACQDAGHCRRVKA